MLWPVDNGQIVYTNSLRGWETNLNMVASTNWIGRDVIELLIKEGEICKVRGHIWRDGCAYSYNWKGGPSTVCLTIHSNPVRHCELCRKEETREIGEWK